MANELQVGVNYRFEKNAAIVDGSATITADVAGDHFVNAVQTIGATPEAIAMGDVDPGGSYYLYLRNLDDTIAITLAHTGNDPVLELQPGDVALVRWYGVNDGGPFATAASSTADLEYAVIEE